MDPFYHIKDEARAEAQKATHRISACYFPGTGEVELTWEDLSTGEEVGITAPVTSDQGERIAKIVPACVYHDAINRTNKT